MAQRPKEHHIYSPVCRSYGIKLESYPEIPLLIFHGLSIGIFRNLENSRYMSYRSDESGVPDRRDANDRRGAAWITLNEISLIVSRDSMNVLIEWLLTITNIQKLSSELECKRFEEHVVIVCTFQRENRIDQCHIASVSLVLIMSVLRNNFSAEIKHVRSTFDRNHYLANFIKGVSI
jgi:hypothetical protein